MGGGFRMGPFELMDLVGIDVGFEVSKSFWEQSFHEPRWRPSMIQARMVQAGRLGRKTGRGYYEYDEDPARPRTGPMTPTRRRRAVRAVVAVMGEGTDRRGPARRRRAGRIRRAGPESNGKSPADRRRRGHEPLSARRGADDRRPLHARPDPVRRRQPGGAGHPGRRRSASMPCPRSKQSRLVELTRGARDVRRDARRAERVLPLPRQARRVGRRRSRPGAGPDRVPARERSGLCGLRGRGRAARTSTRRCATATTIRAARWSGPTRSSWTTCWPRSTRSTEEFGEERYRACAAAAPDGRRGPAGRGDRQRVLRVRLAALLEQQFAGRLDAEVAVVLGDVGRQRHRSGPPRRCRRRRCGWPCSRSTPRRRR